jgi:class 3 adenylate cyclase/tetratricopeptide (TPR) repeat protein
MVPVAERRLVTVLFADLVGFTTWAEPRDPEVVRETLTRYFDTARSAIELHGGRVEKFIGDAVMALWGAPTAREDDAERAVRAALELVDAVSGIGDGISLRAGVLTGEAAVTIGATNEGMVAGDLVNTAARIQSVAPPGGVLVGESTMRASSSAITFEPAGEHELKGKAAPVATWRALRVVAQRGGHGRSDLPEPPFVGRDEELRLLKELLATTGRDAKARLVSVTGPGGIGKSRLAWELEKYIDGIVGDVYWHRGRSPSYGEGVSFWALGEMVRRRAGLAEDADADTTRARVAATLDEYVPDATERRWIESALLALLGVEVAPAGGRDVLFAGWRTFFERIAARGPTVLLFEDLQWADSGLLEFIEHLLEWSKGVPLLVIGLARPELVERRPNWGATIRNHTRMALEPLSAPAMRELLDGFVPGLPRQAVDAILARADGMPLYAVETVRALVADGRLEQVDGAYRPTDDLTVLAIPETLRSLIASRLDALDRVERGLVADASVLGLSFSTTSLAALAGLPADELDRHLRTLVRRELFDVETDPRSPELGQHRFVQSLIREVAYGTLARRDRRARHLAAARHYESLGEPELAGALAAHYVAARDASEPGAEADALAIQARLALVAAAERATSLGSQAQAIRYFSDAADLATDPRERAALLTRAAHSAATASRYAEGESLALAAMAVATAVGDQVANARATATLAVSLIDVGRVEDSVAVVRAAVDSLSTEAPGEVRAELLTTLSRALMRSLRHAEAIEVADGALDLAEHLQMLRLVAEALNNKGAALGYLGRRIEGNALIRAAVETARAAGDVSAELRAMVNLGGTTDDPTEGNRWMRQALDLANRVGSRMIANWAIAHIRSNDYNLADWDRAARLDGYGESIDDVDHSPVDEVRNLDVIGLIAAARGEPIDWVLERIQAVQAVVPRPVPGYVMLGLRAERALLAGDEAVALRDATAGAKEDVELPNLSLAIRAAVWTRDAGSLRPLLERLDVHPEYDAVIAAERLAGHAAIAAMEGRLDEARDGYHRSLSVLRENHWRFFSAIRAIDMLVALGPADRAAREAADEARATFESVGAVAYLAKLDATLASADAAAPSGSPAQPAAVATGSERTA